MEKNYVAIHVVTTMDACGYKHHRLVENKQEGMLVVAKLEESGIYCHINYSKVILTGAKLKAWKTYLAEK